MDFFLLFLAVTFFTLLGFTVALVVVTFSDFLEVVASGVVEVSAFVGIVTTLSDVDGSGLDVVVGTSTSGSVVVGTSTPGSVVVGISTSGTVVSFVTSLSSEVGSSVVVGGAVVVFVSYSVLVPCSIFKKLSYSPVL